MTNLAKELGGQNHLFVDDVHQYHVCQHATCKENRAFEKVQTEKGGYYLAQKIMRRSPYRLYDRKYPFDSTAKAIQLDEVQDTLGQESNYLENIISEEQLAAFKATLTPKQLYVTELIEQGYSPMDIAGMQGKTDSGAERYHKHIVKTKAEEFWKDEAND